MHQRRWRLGGRRREGLRARRCVVLRRGFSYRARGRMRFHGCFRDWADSGAARLTRSIQDASLQRKWLRGSRGWNVMRSQVSPVGFRFQLRLHLDPCLALSSSRSLNAPETTNLSQPKYVPVENFCNEASNTHRPRSDDSVEDFEASLRDA